MNKRWGTVPSVATVQLAPSRWLTDQRNTGSPTNGTTALRERNIQGASPLRVADKELPALLATDRAIQVVHSINYGSCATRARCWRLARDAGGSRLTGQRSADLTHLSDGFGPTGI